MQAPARTVDLDAYLRGQAAQPFDWTTHNCAHFAGGWVLLKTGRNVLAKWEALMPRTRAALRELRKAGGHKAATDAVLGPHLSGQYAARGDIVLTRFNPAARLSGRYFGIAWGVCTGRQIAALGTQDLVMLPINHAEAAWRIV